ncbi:MAG: TonB-dependent receptor plug domain-containing protein [Pseudomonadota bacterium]|nr:TonB-dependent receptor plug domain-containing protein [Pseudomonadota bacterium]
MRVFTTAILISWMLMLTTISVSADDAYSVRTVDVLQAVGSKLILRSFAPVDFSEYSPSNAFELVQYIPGFSISEQSSKRGLGQASVNILINGNRVAGKNNTLEQVLKRIPFNTIQQITIYEGASLGMPGLSGEVVDIVVDSSGINGTWRWHIEHRDQNNLVDPAYWKANIALTGKHSTTSWSLGIDNNYRRLGHGGPETVFDGAGNISENRQEAASYDRDKPSIALGLEFNPINGNTGHVDISYEHYWQSDLEVRNSSIAILGQRYQRKAKHKTMELSGDYAFDLGHGRLKLIALHNESRQQEQSSLKYSDFNKTPFQSDRQDKLGESILRSEFSWPSADADWQWSLESAYNFLDRYLDGVDSKVDELRFETNVSYSKLLSSALGLQLSLGAEKSQISQSGNIEKDGSFTRAKGLLGITYAASDLTNLYVGVSRKVGQLKFSDFLQTRDINDSNSNESNPDLVPQQAWQLEFKLEQSLKYWGAASIILRAEDIEDIVERVAVYDELEIGRDAVGNIDSAKRYSGLLSVTFEFSPLGFSGARLMIDSQYNRSRLKDPLTNAYRRLGDEIINKVDAELRQDIPQTAIAWGITFEQNHFEPEYLYSQIITKREQRNLVVAYIEHSNLWGLKARFSLRNLLDRVDHQTTRNYDLGRGPGGTLNNEERRARDFGLMYLLTLSGSF